ncbi:MAG: hypothetical protein AAGD96_33745, partial [Chloroflexota bacterium]
MKKKIFLLFTIGICLFVFQTYTGLQPNVAEAQSGVNFQFYPSKIPQTGHDLDGVASTPRGFELRLDESYSGSVDAQTLYCEIDLSECTRHSTFTSIWQATNGKITVLATSPIAEGFYLTRIRKSGENAFGNYDLLVVENGAIISNEASYSSSSSQIAVPTKGSYMIFEEMENQVEAYTRIEIETDNPAECQAIDSNSSGRYSMRFSNTKGSSYFSGENDSLRWCVKNQPSGGLNTTLRPEGGPGYRFFTDLDTVANNNINVKYPINSAGLLTALAPNQFNTNRTRYHEDSDMLMHYNLLPKERRVPNNLNAEPTTIVNFAFGHPFHAPESEISDIYQGFDVWRSEALLPTNGGVIKMRYYEIGINFETLDFIAAGAGSHTLTKAQKDNLITWGVIEDWEWNQDGTINEIKQWDLEEIFLDHNDVNIFCWRTGTDCATAINTKIIPNSNGWPEHKRDYLIRNVKLKDSHVPNGNGVVDKLDLKISGTSRHACINNTQSYKVQVTHADNQKPYHGFLEVMIDGDTSTEALWRDAEGKPIYVHDGQVEVPATAYGSLSVSWNLQFRPFLSHSAVSSTEEITYTPQNGPNDNYNGEYSNAVRPGGCAGWTRAYAASCLSCPACPASAYTVG